MADSTVEQQADSYRTTQGQYAARGTNLDPKGDLVDYVKEYAREKPEVAALWCLGIGFVLGWKLKPW